MAEVLEQDYIRAASARGLPIRTVLVRHAARNALLPLVSVLGVEIAGLFSGALVTETVFTWPGMGLLAFRAFVARDYPVVLATFLISSIVVVVSNFVVDLLYLVLDPRIRMW